MVKEKKPNRSQCYYLCQSKNCKNQFWKLEDVKEQQHSCSSSNCKY